MKRPDLHALTWSKDVICDPRFYESDCAKLVTIMWAIWTSRNNITCDKGGLNPIQSMKMTREMLALLDLPREHARLLPSHGWRPPKEDEIKINIDGNVAMEARRGGVGGVASSHSTFKAAWCKPYQGIPDSLISEALALQDGVIFAS